MNLNHCTVLELLKCAAELGAERGAQRGAEHVLTHLGLENGHAARDLRELRDLLEAWRDATGGGGCATVTR